MLLGAVDEDGGRMSDEQVRDECLTIVLAGHETTANALSFAAWLLASEPEMQERLAAECFAVLGGRAPGGGGLCTAGSGGAGVRGGDAAVSAGVGDGADGRGGV